MRGKVGSRILHLGKCIVRLNESARVFVIDTRPSVLRNELSVGLQLIEPSDRRLSKNIVMKGSDQS